VGEKDVEMTDQPAAAMPEKKYRRRVVAERVKWQVLGKNSWLDVPLTGRKFQELESEFQRSLGANRSGSDS